MRGRPGADGHAVPAALRCGRGAEGAVGFVSNRGAASPLRRVGDLGSGQPLCEAQTPVGPGR